MHVRRRAELRALAERAQIPIAMTLLGIGGVPASHPLNLGMMGMHGEAWVNTAIQEADLLIALGMRFDDRVTGNLKTYAPQRARRSTSTSIRRRSTRTSGRRGDRRRPAATCSTSGCRSVAAGRSRALARAHRRPQGRLGGPRHPEPARRRASVCGARHQRSLAGDRTATRSSSPTSASTRCGKRSTTSTRRRAR